MKIMFFNGVQTKAFGFNKKEPKVGQKNDKFMLIDKKKKSPFAIWYRYVMRKWPAELDFFLWK